MKISVHPVVEIEKKILKSIKGQDILGLLEGYKLKGLSDQDPDEEVPTFQDVLNNINHSVVKLPGKPWEIRYKYKKSSGVTRITLHNEYEINKPTLIFHHGLGHRNGFHLKIITNDILFDKFNIFSIRASNHESTKKVLRSCVNNMVNLTTTVCSSVIAVDEIVDFHNHNSKKPVVSAGFSMGGIISSLHYYYFNTADYYFPIIAHPNFGEIILDKSHKKVIANYDKLVKNKSIVNCFNVPKQLKDKPKNKIFPILGRHDELINHKKALKYWKGYSVTSYDMGHLTVVLKRKEIRNLILSKVFKK